ncbi:MAG: hypothetical protein PHG65_09540, partial [Kiritimatiellae bacterium]|nr:hypothetical protein [Kiritimatiellia bacterium]
MGSITRFPAGSIAWNERIGAVAERRTRLQLRGAVLPAWPRGRQQSSADLLDASLFSAGFDLIIIVGKGLRGGGVVNQDAGFV